VVKTIIRYPIVSKYQSHVSYIASETLNLFSMFSVALMMSNTSYVRESHEPFVNVFELSLGDSILP
jgi:hypothetical protein